MLGPQGSARFWVNQLHRPRRRGWFTHLGTSACIRWCRLLSTSLISKESCAGDGATWQVGKRNAVDITKSLSVCARRVFVLDNITE